MNRPWDEGFEQILRAHLRFLAPRDPLVAGAQLSVLGLDSMGIVQLLLALEEAYEIMFPDEELTADTFASPATLWQAVSSLLTSRIA